MKKNSNKDELLEVEEEDSIHSTPPQKLIIEEETKNKQQIQSKTDSKSILTISKNRPEILASHLKKLTLQSRETKTLQDDPKQFLSNRLRTILKDLFENPEILEKEAKRGKSEIILINLLSLLEQEKQRFSNITL